MPQPLPDDIKAASALAADQFLTLPEAMQRIAELEKLSITLFATLYGVADALLNESVPDALKAQLWAATAAIEVEVTKVLGRPPLQHKAGCE